MCRITHFIRPLKVLLRERPLSPHLCPSLALPHLRAPQAPRRAPRVESCSRFPAPWPWGSGRRDGVGHKGYPVWGGVGGRRRCGSLCTQRPRLRRRSAVAGAGNSGGGGGEREGAEEGRSRSAKAGRGEMGWGRRVLGGGAAREGDESLRRQERRVRAGGKPRKLYPGSGAGAVRHLGGPLCPILCQLPTLDVFILAAPTRSAPSAQWETLPAQ